MVTQVPMQYASTEKQENHSRRSCGRNWAMPHLDLVVVRGGALLSRQHCEQDAFGALASFRHVLCCRRSLSDAAKLERSSIHRDGRCQWKQVSRNRFKNEQLVSLQRVLWSERQNSGRCPALEVRRHGQTTSQHTAVGAYVLADVPVRCFARFTQIIMRAARHKAKGSSAHKPCSHLYRGEELFELVFSTSEW